MTYAPYPIDLSRLFKPLIISFIKITCRPYITEKGPRILHDLDVRFRPHPVDDGCFPIKYATNSLILLIRQEIIDILPFRKGYQFSYCPGARVTTDWSLIGASSFLPTARSKPASGSVVSNTDNKSSANRYPAGGRIGSTNHGLPNRYDLQPRSHLSRTQPLRSHYLLPDRLGSLPASPTLNWRPQNSPPHPRLITWLNHHSRCFLTLLLIFAIQRLPLVAGCPHG